MPKSNENLFRAAHDYQAVIVPDFIRSRAVAWTLAFAFCVLALIAMTALMLLMPLKEKVPVPILVDRITGETRIVDTTIDINRLDAIAALDRYWINRYVQSRETFDLTTLETDYAIVERLSCPKTFQSYAALFRTDNPNNYYTVYKDHTVTVTVNTISRFEDAGAPADDYRVYAINAERHIQNRQHAGAGDTAIKRIPYQILLAVKFTQVSVEERLVRDNPLGFEVCRFSRDQYVEGQP